MNSLKLELLEGEEIILESGPAVLTDRRLLANWKGTNGGRARDKANLEDISTFRKINGGKESRLKQGLMLGATGLILIALEAILPDLNSDIQFIVFMAGALATIMGFHFSLSSLLRIRPHTTVLFDVEGAKKIAVSFPGRDNPDADEFARVFGSTKRDMSAGE